MIPTAIRSAQAVLLSLLCACGPGSGGEPSGPTATPQIQESRANVLPEGFPRDIPVPGDRTVVLSLTQPGGQTVYARSKTPEVKLREAFVEGLKSSGWAIVACHHSSGPEGPMTVIAAAKPPAFTSVTIGPGREPRTKTRYDYVISVAKTGGRTPAGPSATCAPAGRGADPPLPRTPGSAGQ
ncbi:MAG TPA: hypothetical protein VNE62_09515 [Actinomycetota bacterium]|nr:hypothetical protein [Actinomycetota bacterium]